MGLGRPQDDYGPGPGQPPKLSQYGPATNQALYGPGAAQVPLPGSPGPKRTSGGPDPYVGQSEAYNVSNLGELEFTQGHLLTS
jgi:hypothetical protein